jgi:hypothetical protein
MRATRTTRIAATKPFQLIKELGFYIGLKRVHLYVFKNWRVQAEQCSDPDGERTPN